jgi:hypothetical protein
MSTHTITPSPTANRPAWRSAARWLPTFAGFPLGGLISKLLSGPVDSLTAALFGGLITGAVLGAAQSWGLGGSGRNGPAARRWIAATAIGLMVGLGIGAAAVGYDTSLSALVIQGAISGLAVGTAQALLLRPRLGRLALAWPPALAAIWALGWAVTASAGIQVEEQFTVFGSSGAIVVTALTAVLPVVINSRKSSRS